jgi:hypothetical protein
VVACRACGVVLEEGDSPEEGREGSELVRLVTLAPVSSLVEGSMLRGALESQGLHPRLVSHLLPAHGQILRDWATHHWGELRVPEDEVEEARLVLEDFREAVSRIPPLDATPEGGGESKEERG